MREEREGNHFRFNYTIYDDAQGRCELQYFPASIIEKVDPDGKIHNELRVFNEQLNGIDTEIPDRAFVKQLKDSPVLMFWITMYQEEWYQILQSIAGCIRAILELEDADPVTYSPDKFGITLIAGM